MENNIMTCKFHPEKSGTYELFFLKKILQK